MIVATRGLTGQGQTRNLGRTQRGGRKRVEREREEASNWGEKVRENLFCAGSAASLGSPVKNPPELGLYRGILNEGEEVKGRDFQHWEIGVLGAGLRSGESKPWETGHMERRSNGKNLVRGCARFLTKRINVAILQGGSW